MNPFEAISKLYTVSREAEGALDAFHKTIADGGSIAEAVRAFAAETDSTQMDDVVVKDVIEGLNYGIEYLGKAADFLAILATMVEQNGPNIVDTCRSISIGCTKVAMQAQVLRG